MITSVFADLRLRLTSFKLLAEPKKSDFTEIDEKTSISLTYWLKGDWYTVSFDTREDALRHLQGILADFGAEHVNHVVIDDQAVRC